MLNNINLLILAVAAIVVWLFFSRGCRIRCGDTRENMYLSANTDEITLGTPSDPSSQLKTLKDKGWEDAQYGESLAIE